MDLVIDNLACRRGGRLVFRGLSARVEAGQAMAVRGPNGVGKSSLLRVLAGLTPPVSGGATLGAHRLDDRSAWQEQIAYAGHLDAIKPALSVRQNLDVWAGLFGAGPGRVGPALERFGLDEIAGRPTAQCSAGQKRRLGLARLMVLNRPLWLLDEPTVSLDAAATAKVAELVRAHVGNGGIALVATHVDLGLGDIPVLEMSPGAPPPDAPGTTDDAFLDGAWR